MMLAACFFLVHASAWHSAAVVVKEEPAAVLAGHGDDIGEWIMAPRFPNVTSATLVHATSPSLSTTHIKPAIGEIKANHKNVCATLKRSLMGGLSNTIGILNAPMEFSLLQNLTWVMPEIRPPAHHTGDQFVRLFGDKPEVADDCPEKMVPLWEAHCYTESYDKLGFDGTRFWFGGGRCHPDAMEVADKTPDTRVSTYCGCDAIVEFHETSWHFYYAVTGPVLSKLYWKDRDYPDFKFPLNVVHHIRLGDQRGWTDGMKFVNGTVMAELVGAFAQASQMDARCLRVKVVTDGELVDEHVRMVRDAWRDIVGVRWTDVSDITDPVMKSMNFMTKADILIGGSSGFPRFAAVVTKARVKVFYENPDMDHPIHYLSGATAIPYGSDKQEMKEMMENNHKLKELAHQCDDWLSK